MYIQYCIDYTQKIEMEFLLIMKIQQTEFDTFMSIDANTANDSMTQQQLANIVCYICIQKGHYRKNCPNSAGTIKVQRKHVNDTL